MAFDKLPSKATLKPTPFKAEVPEKDLADFKQLLKLSPLGPHTWDNSGQDERNFGVTYQWMSEAKQRWESGYDWRKTEAKINSFPNYAVDIKNEGGDGDGETVNVHFIGLFSEKKDAIPIVLLHGWPGSFLEFLGILSLLTSRYSSASELPYHVIVPSLPGYGYSGGAPANKNWLVQDIARVINHLMVGLGFADGYVTQGGDIGSFVSRVLGVDHESCKAVHLNMVMMAKPDGVDDSSVDPFELQNLKRLQNFSTTGSAYNKEHATRPGTIGHVLSSSPLAVLAWVGEKFIEWSDETPPLDEILDGITLYWLTSSFPRSIYPYRQITVDAFNGPSRWHIPANKGFGYSYFTYELGPVPKEYAATTGNLTFYRRHDRGGHFAAWEKPDVLWGDIEEFIAGVWGKVGPKL